MVRVPSFGDEVAVGNLGVTRLRTISTIFFLFVVILARMAVAQPAPSESERVRVGADAPLEITAETIEYDQTKEEYSAHGSVVASQGSLRLTADHANFSKLSGRLTALGHVHLNDKVTDLWTERLELDVNTEAGVITQGRLFLKDSNTFITGRLLQRFSETHYRAKDGSFTNCDAKDGQVPAWRFTFEDVDVDLGDSVYGKDVWLRVKDYPVLPLPALRYPVLGKRKTGLLIPEVGIDNEFGFRYRQGFFWAISPSQDLTLTPQVLSKRGGGAALEYRYLFSRENKGQWLVNSLYDTDEDRARALITGSHLWHVNPDLTFRTKVNYATDRSLINDFSSSGVLRALPSQESNLLLNQRLTHGGLFLLGQYLQPLEDGNDKTFQRVPELAHRFVNFAVPGSPFLIGVDSTFSHFFREKGFDVSRIDIVPTLTTQGLNLGHVVGLRPQLKLREVIYSHGPRKDQDEFRTRGTVWGGFEVVSNLARRFKLGGNRYLRHSIEPKVVYEYSPDTRPSRVVQVDAVDELVEKNLLTYSLRTRLNEAGGKTGSNTWLDLFLAQSYHLNSPPGDAKRFSDIWLRTVLNKPSEILGHLTQLSLVLDSFYDPNREKVSQFNSDARIQSGNRWYASVGQRFTRSGRPVRRGDIWNPISFNEVLDPIDKINFLTAGGAVRLTHGVSAGTKWYHDFGTGETPEWDVVGLYQDPCRCWSLGVYYIQFPDREQYSFLLSLTGVGTTPGFGSNVIEAILNPLFGGERGVPWRAR